MSQFDEKEKEGQVLIDINHLTFAYPGRPQVLTDLNMQLTAGSRCLLIGANGAGKSTLLRILAGKHLVKPDESVRILGKSCFYDTSLNFDRSYLDTDWGMRTVAFAGYGCPLQADIPVHGMMTKLQNEFPERRDELIKLLRIDPNWRMHQVSDGQRRRVQIFIGLLRPFKVLFLDEVTVSLDVIVRQDLLQWLKEESVRRQATIIYATHIFDGLDDWPTHLQYLNNKGCTGWQGRLWDLEYYQELRKIGHPSPLLKIAERWLRTELIESNYKTESAQGIAAQAVNDPTQVSTNAGGGFSNGRMAAYDFIGIK
jgi:CCR4-NOT complex subunit CAF16